MSQRAGGNVSFSIADFHGRCDRLLSTELEQLKVSLTADARGPQIVLDYEDRDVLVFGDYYGAQNAGLGAPCGRLRYERA